MSSHWPTAWVTADGTSIPWADAPAGRAQAIGAVRLGLEKQKWREAAAHYCGQCLAEGTPSFAGYLAAKRFLVKNSQQQAAKYLTNVGAGGAATGKAHQE